MKTPMKPLLIASLIAVVGLASYAQTTPEAVMDHGMHGAMQSRMHAGMDPSQREARMAKHLGELKAKLRLTAAQEDAWTMFTAATKPPAGREHKRPDPAEMDKLSTPERMDKMQAMHTEHTAQRTAAMERQGAAIKAFYNELSADQKKTFDTEHSKMMRGRDHMKGKASGARASHSAHGATTPTPPAKN